MRVFTLMIVGLALATMPGCAGCKKEQPAKKAAPGEPAAADEPEAEKAPLAAPRTALELIPDNAAFAVAVPSLSELKRKTEALVESAGLGGHIKISELFDEIFTKLKLEKGRDDSLPAAALLSSLAGIEGAGFAALDALPQYAVYTVGVSDLDAAFPDKGPEFERLKTGEIVDGAQASIFQRGHLITAGALFFKTGSPGDPKARLARLQRVLDGPSAQTSLGSDAPNADLVFHLSPRDWGPGWRYLKDESAELLSATVKGPNHDALAQAVAALHELRFVVATINLDGGVQGSVSALFETGKKATALLRALRAGDQSADLKGLPAHVPIVAMSARGDGTKNRPLLEGAMKHGLSLVMGATTEGALTSVLDVLGQLWGGLNASRFAIYPSRTELPALVMILDTDDPAVVHTSLKTLVDVFAKDQMAAGALHWTAKAETVAGSDVAHLSLKGGPDGAGKAGGMVVARVATFQGQLVVQAGARPELLEETLTLLGKKGAGLADLPLVKAASAKLGTGAQLELLLSVAGVQELMSGQPTTVPTLLSGAALTLKDDRIQLEVWAPGAEIKAGNL